MLRRVIGYVFTKKQTLLFHHHLLSTNKVPVIPDDLLTTTLTIDGDSQMHMAWTWSGLRTRSEKTQGKINHGLDSADRRCHRLAPTRSRSVHGCRLVCFSRLGHLGDTVTQKRDAAMHIVCMNSLSCLEQEQNCLSVSVFRCPDDIEPCTTHAPERVLSICDDKTGLTIFHSMPVRVCLFDVDNDTVLPKSRLWLVPR